MKIKHQLIIILSLVFTVLHGQTQIKLMTYNLLYYPDGVQNIDRKNHLRYILNDYQPDIFMVCELESETGSDEIINYCLQIPDQHYASASFSPNHSGNYALQQMLYYNTQKLELIDESYLRTYVRDINHYTLKLLTQTPDTIDVFVAHLKAGSNQTNEDIRHDMVNVMTNDLQNIPSSHYVVFAGDFNLYNSNEPAYQEIIDPNNAIILKDPINLPGNWHVNYDIRAFVTQSTHVNYSDYYVSGGLDDRFDFIMLSENFFNNSHLHYLTNSYKSYGNNGNCFNNAINDSSCDGAQYNSILREHLYVMSDHLPVILSLESEQTLSNETYTLSKDYHIIGSNLINKQLRISTADATSVSIAIYNYLGQIVLTRQYYKNNDAIDISELEKGIYFIKIKAEQQIQTLKFVKIY